jgi:hypothetical protein
MKDKNTCKHLNTRKEYLGGMDTGDLVCQDCRAVSMGKEWPKQKLEK